MKMDNIKLREVILEELVQGCSFVDKCDKKCVPSDHEDCYGLVAGNIIIAINEHPELAVHTCHKCGEIIKPGYVWLASGPYPNPTRYYHEACIKESMK
uniref:Uncharacterized protein n=1 Tax=viral metagenome TaxID=1070528 RepID=A0A6M3K378_9ZZZZ